MWPPADDHQLDCRCDSPLPRADPIRNAGVGGEAGLLLLLNRLAVESRHDEVRNAPLLFWGHSAAASFGISFAGLHPDRTIGFVRYHGNLRGQPVNIRSVSDITQRYFWLVKRIQSRALKTRETYGKQAGKLTRHGRLLYRLVRHTHRLKASAKLMP